MDGLLLRFYVHQGERHHGMLAWEWLLKQASELGIRGGSAFRALAGFGRHHVLHEQTFFRLSGSCTVEIDFIVTDREARDLMAIVHRAGLRIFFSYVPAHFGVVNPDSEDLAELQTLRSA